MQLQNQENLDDAIEAYNEAISIIDNDNKGKKNLVTKTLTHFHLYRVLVKLNRNEESLDSLNKVHDFSKEITVGQDNLIPSRMAIVQKYITDDRYQLIEKVRELQEKFISAKTLVDKIDDKQAKEAFEALNQENQNKLINVKIYENIAAEVSRARTTEELDIINKLIEERQKNKHKYIIEIERNVKDSFINNSSTPQD